MKYKNGKGYNYLRFLVTGSGEMVNQKKVNTVISTHQYGLLILVKLPGMFWLPRINGNFQIGFYHLHFSYNLRRPKWVCLIIAVILASCVNSILFVYCTKRIQKEFSYQYFFHVILSISSIVLT